MNLTRLLHDGYAFLSHRWGSPLEQVEKPSQRHLLSERMVQDAGNVRIDNAFEASVLEAGEPELEYSYPGVRAMELRDVYMAERYGYLFLSPVQMLPLNAGTLRVNPGKIRRPIPLLARSLTMPLVHLCGPNDENHGHFILDFLSRLEPWNQILQEDPSRKILLSGRAAGWKLDYLRRMGIPENRIVMKPEGTVLCSRLSYSPIPCGLGKLPSPEILKWVAERLGERVPQRQEEVPPLLISRQTAPNKRLSNEPELIRVAEEVLGKILVMRLEDHSFDEQVHLFRNTPFVIGAVGQGLVNLLFSTGAMSLILTPEHGFGQRSWSRAYHNLSILSGNRSVVLKSPEEVPRNADWAYPADPFRKVLVRMKEACR